MNQSQNATESTIRELAHKLWEENGCPEGRSEEFWFKAQQTLAAIPVMKPVTKPAKKGKSARR